MAQANVKPPVLRTGDNYETWKHKIRLWERCTNLALDARAPAIALTLEGSAQSAVIKTPIDTLASDNGVEVILNKLDKLFEEDKDKITYTVYDEFERFRKTKEMSMTDYLVEFELKYDIAKQYGNILPQPVLAYRLLKGANLSEQKQELARATCAQWNYETLKVQLKKIFDHSASKEGGIRDVDTFSHGFSELNIKSEPTNFALSHNEEEAYFGRSKSQNEEDTYFGRSKGNISRNYERRYYEPRRREESQRNFGRRYEEYGHREENARQLNPMFNGVRMKCISCKSIYHLIKDCPHKSNRGSNPNWRNTGHQTYMLESGSYEPDEVFVQLFMSSLIQAEDTEKEITECYVSTLVGECLQKCILDSGCNQNVAGIEWSDDYIASLSDQDRLKVVSSPSNTKFKFGDGKTYTAIGKVNVPAEIAKNKVMIEYHIVEAELPLLLSKNGMKDARCKMDYANERVEMFGRPIQPGFTKSGHYTISLSPKVQAGTTNDKSVNVLFSIKDINDKSYKEKSKMMEKVHKTFGHPSEIRLKKLIKDGGIEDEEILKAIENVTSECEICKKYKRTPSHPIVTTSLARHFNEVVTLDLFFHNNIPIMHICDVATRFSRASVLPSKNKNAIISAFCILWVSLFGPPQKILSDNGGEFTSHDFREMGEKLNTQILSTAAESPWSNGINERHHALITDMLEKILEENKFPLSVALSWAVAAKNALANVYGYSPNQLVFGTNPNYPSALTSELPALENEYNSKNILTQMQAREAAREAFIKAESSEKLKRAMNRQTRTSNPLEYEIGEEVFYKREQEGRWRGPGRIVGKDGKIILIRHQASVISVPSCMITHRYPNNGRHEGVNRETLNLPPKVNCQTPTSSNSIDSDDEWGATYEPTERIQGEILPANEAVDEMVQQNLEARRVGRPPKKKNKKEQISLPPINSEIIYKIKNEDIERRGKVTSKAGKSTGANRFCLNVLNMESNLESCINFEKQISEWKIYEEKNEEILFGTILNTKEVDEAKQLEILKWKNYDVFEEIENEGQATTSVRWVITKAKENVKARLVARGYEEESFKEMRKDSPTIGKSTFRLTLAIIASNKWDVNSMDIQAAYLQGEPVDREVLLKPPPEAENPNMLWKLKKSVYGLGDGGRMWYLKVEQEVTKLNATKSKYDPAVFMWYDDEGDLQGIIAAHVDDFLWGGNEEFKSNTIKTLKEIFKISKEQQDNFKHLGLEIEQNENEITVSQRAYINEMQPINYDKNKNKDDELNEDERKALRTYVGQIQWIASQTRPDIAFNACEASVEFSKSTVNTIHKANKTIKKMKYFDVKLKFPNLGNLKNCTIICFTDASLKNLPGNNSQYGYFIFLSKDNTVVPITWKSAKCKRVVNNTIGAECLGLIEGSAASYYIRKVLSEILKVDETEIPIECYIDCKNLYDAVRTTHSITDNRVLADVCEIRDKISKKEITKIHWIRSQYQLANVLTKNNAAPGTLLAVLEENKI